jgi:hypothetical protein
MKKFLTYFLLLNIILLLSCDKKRFKADCIDCMWNEPAEIKLIVTSDPYKDGMYREPEIRVYEGNLEDSILVESRTADLSPTNISVYINKKYTITATYYYYHSKTYVVVESVSPSIYYVGEKCDHPCYIVINNKVNLQLRYM